MKFKKYLLNYSIYFFIVYAAAMLILFPEIAADGAYSGIVSSLEVLIPSLFPFMVLTLFLTESSLYKKLLKIPSVLLSKIAGIHEKYCGIFFLGMIGGYPSAAKNISILCKKGEISKQNAEILLCFCTNAGPSFLISAVGYKMFLSGSIGAILFISSILSSFTLIFIYKNKLKVENQIRTAQSKASLSSNLVSAVLNSCRAILMVCSFVILFSVFLSFVPNFQEHNSTIQAIFFGIFEVTSATSYAASNISLLNVLIASAVCGFGGLCVIIQITSICSEANLSVKRFILSRFLNSFFNTLYTLLLLIMIPINVTETYINNSVSAAADVFSAPLPALMLLLSCVAFPICVTKRKKS